MIFLLLIFENSSVCLGDLVFGGQFGVSGSPLLLFFFFLCFSFPRENLVK